MADANATKYFTGDGRLRALVLLLDGKQDAALVELADSFRSGSYAIGGTPSTTIPCGCRCMAIRDSRLSPPTCGAMSTRSAASSKYCADTGTCRGAETRPPALNQRKAKSMAKTGIRFGAPGSGWSWACARCVVYCSRNDRSPTDAHTPNTEDASQARGNRCHGKLTSAERKPRDRN